MVQKRVDHVIHENYRVLASVECLERNDLVKFGELLTQSHASLRDLYEVTCPELDVLVDAALACEGVLGSRMTGAGFGGCTVSLVRDISIDGFIQYVSDEYRKKTGMTASFYVTEPGDGGREL